MAYRDTTPIDPNKDYQVEELAKFIREKMYGEDTREAMALALEKAGEVAEWSREVAQQIIDGGFDEGVLNTEIERKLNELEQQYAPELNNVKTQLAETVQGESGKKVRSLAGVIRNVGEGFEFIQDATHEPMNLESLVTDNTRITLNHGFNAKKVISLTVTPDETLASLGYTFGASVGTDLSYIYPYKTDDVYGYFTKSGGQSPVFTPLASFCKGIESTEWDGVRKELVVHHDKCYSPLNVDLKTRDVSLLPVSSSFSPNVPSEATYVSFHSNSFVSGFVSYVDEVWKIDPGSSGVVSAVWNTVENRLEVVIANTPGIAPNVDSKTGRYRAVGVSSGENVVFIQFIDVTGAVIKTPDVHMQVLISKVPNNKVKIIPEDGQVLLFTRQGGVSPVDPNEITEIGGNIWIEGIMEVE